MSLYNDYSVQLLSQQRIRDFRAEAANDRLVRIATGGHSPWWRRLFTPPARSVPVTAGVAPSRGTTGRGLGQLVHRVAR